MGMANATERQIGEDEGAAPKMHSELPPHTGASSGPSGTVRRALARGLASPGGRALIALVLVVLLGVVFNADGAFFRVATHRDTLRQASVPGILACGMTLVIITGGIDLAVGSILALVAVMFSYMSIHWGWTPLV